MAKRKVKSNPGSSPTSLSSTAILLQSTSVPDDLSVDSTQQLVHHDAKKKKSSQARIGQACDRCRTRKLTCDPAPVCRYCAKARIPCLTTDRLTGRVYPRGELERLERNANDQFAYIQTLEARLRALGEDVRPYEEAYPTTAHLMGSPALNFDDDEGETHSRRDSLSNGLPIVLHNVQMGSNSGPQLPDLRTGQADKYLGVSTSSSIRSAHESKLKMLGYELPICTSDNFNDPEGSEPQQYNRSYTSFIASTFEGSARGLRVELPVKEHGFKYARGYLGMMNAFLPILHKTTFLTLLTKLYDCPTVEHSPADYVLVHMMFASILLQAALRNEDDVVRRKASITKSNLHYHYSLGKISDLMIPSVENVQALAMICSHVRFFPDPEIGWTLTHMVLNKAIELGLHRSVSRGASTDMHITLFDLEMRKRIFWSLITISVTINGKLGRPMPLRIRDLDIEVPEALDDDLFDETSVKVSSDGNCQFLIAIEEFKVVPIFMDLYDEIYSTQRSSTYIEFVRNGEKRIKAWCDQWPLQLRDDANLTNPILSCFNHYLNMFTLEYRLLLRHPSLSLTKSAKFNDASLKACMDICHEMMNRASSLQRSRSLDTTWCSCAVFVLAIQTTLYGHSQLNAQLTPEALKSVKSDMDVWLSIMGHISSLLETRKRLQSTMREQVDVALTHLERRVVSNVPHNLSMVNTRTPVAKAPLSNNTSFSHDQFDRTHQYKVYENWNPEPPPNHRPNEYMNSNGNVQTQNSYQMAQYHYPDPSNSNTYSAADPPYVPAPYSTHLPTQALANSSHYQPQTVPNSADNLYHNMYGIGPQSWNLYTQALPPVHDYTSANALLQLGGRGQMPKEGMIGVGGASGMGSSVENSELLQEESWPWQILGNPHGSS